jgi:hypothetical protein
MDNTRHTSAYYNSLTRKSWLKDWPWARTITWGLICAAIAGAVINRQFEDKAAQEVATTRVTANYDGALVGAQAEGDHINFVKGGEITYTTGFRFQRAYTYYGFLPISPQTALQLMNYKPELLMEHAKQLHQQNPKAVAPGEIQRELQPYFQEAPKQQSLNLPASSIFAAFHRERGSA